MATAPGATGNWIYVGGGQWSPAGQSVNEGQTDWYALEPGGPFTGPDANIVNTVGRYGGTADEIARMLTGMSADQYQSTYGVPLDYTAAARGITPYTTGTGTTHIGSRPTLSSLQASGINTAANPNLTAWDQQMTQQAQQQAQSINDVNSQGITPQQLAMMAAMVYGGGYLMGTGLGAAQGLGSYGSLLANPGMTGTAATNFGAGGAGAIPWEQAYAGSDLGGSLVQTGADQGAGMDWFSDWGSNFGPTGEGLYPTGAEDFAGSWAGGGGVDYSGIPLELGGEFGTNPSTLGLSNESWLQQLGSLPYDKQISAISQLQGLSGQDWYKTAAKLLGSGLGGGGGGGAGAGGNDPWGVNRLFGGAGGGLGDLLGKGLGLAPVLAALNYGYNQTGFDTGRLEDLYGQYNPQAMAGLYDMNTGLERDQLTSSLGRRGVLGSSFGNMDLANFNTRRDIGRQQLISGAVAPATDIASKILTTNIAERKLKNDLLGQGVNAIGRMFSGSPGGGGYAGTSPTSTAGGNDWWNSILRGLGSTAGTQIASNPLDVWNI